MSIHGVMSAETTMMLDYQNYYTFLGVLPQREIFVSTANSLIKAGDKERALKVLDKCQESNAFRRLAA